MSKRLGYLILEVRDLDAWSAFAGDVFGFEVQRVDDDCVRIRLDDHAYRIILQRGDADDVARLGFEVDSLEDLDVTHRRLQARGLEATAAASEVLERHQVHSMVQATLPGGIEIDLVYGPTAAPHQPTRNPWVSHGFRTGELGLGHVVLATPEAVSVGDCLVDDLDFRISDYERPSPDASTWGTFYHCNPRHHTVALGTRDAARRLNHFMVELNEIDDMGRLYDRAMAAGVVDTMIGRHINDRMLGFYAFTPSGFRMEIGVLGKLITADHRVERHDSWQAWGGHRVSELESK